VFVVVVVAAHETGHISAIGADESPRRDQAPDPQDGG
jgi:hypothetical protein